MIFIVARDSNQTSANEFYMFTIIICMYWCVNANEVFFGFAEWVSCSNILSCADVAFPVEILCGTMNGQLPVVVQMK